MADDLDARLDALYAGPAAGFTAARDALAKELRAAGDRDGAARVAALRRPTKLAAELNRLARDRPAELAAAITAQDALARVQQDMLAGEAGADELRDAAGAEAAAIAALSDDLDARAAVRAAARREGERDALRRGRLSHDPEPDLGAGLLGGHAPGPAQAAPRRRAAPPPAGESDELAQRRARRAEEARSARRESLAEARGLARTAAAGAREARRRLDRARAARERAEAARDRVDAEAARRRADLERAAAAEGRSAAEAAEAERLAADAERLVAELDISD